MSSKAREALEKIRSCADYIYSYPNNIGGVQQCARDIMETIDEIVREMRNLARLDKESADMIPRKHMLLALSEYANRIEKTYKREREATCDKSSQVGNAAAMREALEAFVQLANDGVIQPRTYGESEHQCFCALWDQVVSALSTPPRNCDRQYRNSYDVLKYFTDETGRQIFNTSDVIDWLLFTEAKGEQK